MKHRFTDILNAYDYSSGGDGKCCVYLCRETGRFYYVSEYGDSDEDLPEDLDEAERYIPIPDQRELNLGSELAHRFIRERAPELADKVHDIFSRRGAYARFKALLEANNLLQNWFEYEAEQTEAGLRAWCQANQILLDKESSHA